MTKQKKTKPLHQQKDLNSSNDLAFGAKFSSNAWYDDEENNESEADSSSWLCLKNQLIKFHDTSNVMRRLLLFYHILSFRTKSTTLNENKNDLASLKAY